MTDRINKYKIRRMNRLLKRMDADSDGDEKGQWITTENGHHVHISDEGVPDKGNPKVIGSMVSGRLKEIFDSSETASDSDLGKALLELPVGYIIEINGKRYKRRDEEGYGFETYPGGKKVWEVIVGEEIKGTKECKIFGTEDDLDEEPVVMEYVMSDEKKKEWRSKREGAAIEKIKNGYEKGNAEDVAYGLQGFAKGFIFEIGGKKYMTDGNYGFSRYPSGEKISMYRIRDHLEENGYVVLYGHENDPYSEPKEFGNPPQKVHDVSKWSPEKGFKLKHDADSFSQERKDKAVWDTEGGAVADAVLRPVVERLWNQSGFDRRVGFFYTAHSDDINDLLRGVSSGGETERDISVTQDNIDSLTKNIDMSEAPTDIWLQRGCSIKSLGMLFNVPERDWGTLESGSPEEIMSLITSYSDYGHEKAFMSCGSSEGRGATRKKVFLKIYCPKGTKMLYVEPFSRYGMGGKAQWNGKDKQADFSMEDETILQRGTMLVPRKVSVDEEHTYIDVDVIGQEY